MAFHAVHLMLLLPFFASGCQLTPIADSKTSARNGIDVINQMHDRYAGRWYQNIRVTQELNRYDRDGKAIPQPTWTEIISLPGRVRSVIGDAERGNYELYVNGAFTIVQGDQVIRRLEQAHPVLHVGYDVYCQPPSVTANQLEEGGFDLKQFRTTTWNDEVVYVVGAEPGDETTPQFWVDVEKLLCRRIITKTQSGKPLDIQFTRYVPFENVWLCTELKFYLSGQLLIHEWDIGHELIETIEPDTFSIPSG